MQYEKYLLSTFPIAIVSFLLGLTLLKDLNFEFRAEGLKDAFINIYPILALLLIYLIFRNLIVAVMVSILIVILHKKVGIEDLKLVIKKAFDLRILALVFAVIGYKNIIEFSKSAEALYEEISFSWFFNRYRAELLFYCPTDISGVCRTARKSTSRDFCRIFWCDVISVSFMLCLNCGVL
jgi:hypothetical protein